MTDTVKVRTNNVPRDIVYFFELDEKQQTSARNEWDWMADDEIEDAEFFFYKGELYCMADFQAVHNEFWNPNPPEWMKGWDGYTNDTAFSGMLVKYPREEWGDLDTEHVIVGYYYG
jgi:hypothetical protein